MNISNKARDFEGGTYSDLSVNGTVLIRGRCLFETWSLLEETQPAFTCLKSTIETPEQRVKSVQS